jgi:glutathione synthase
MTTHTPIHLFVIDPLETLNKVLDSSLRLMFELSTRRQEVYVCEPRQLAWNRSANTAHAHTTRIDFSGGPSAFSTTRTGSKMLGDFAAIHMRKDPPYDLDYIAATWLLDSVKLARQNENKHKNKHRTRIYNEPRALRDFNEKLAFFHFGHLHDDVKPALVSADPQEILSFIDSEARGDAVLKPLTLFGGRGVERITLDEKKTHNSKTRFDALAFIRKETAEGTSPRLVQAFDEAIFTGEVRAFTAFGKPIAWCLKKPAAGSFLANTRAGAQLLPYQPSAAEVERVGRLSRDLLAKGVAFIGFDLIGGFVSEINITSPRLLAAASDDHNYYKDIADLIDIDLAH